MSTVTFYTGISEENASLVSSASDIPNVGVSTFQYNFRIDYNIPFAKKLHLNTSIYLELHPDRWFQNEHGDRSSPAGRNFICRKTDFLRMTRRNYVEMRKETRSNVAL